MSPPASVGEPASPRPAPGGRPADAPAGRLVWYGELTTRRRLACRGGLLLAGGLLWLTVFLALPALVLAAMAFTRSGDYGQVVWQFTLENFGRLAGRGRLGWSADHLRILARTLLVAGVTTVACVALAYPLAFFIAGRPRPSRYLWLAAVVIPFCTNLVVRTYAWMLLLSSPLPPARLAAALGLAPEGGALYPGPLAVYLGMVSSFLPFAVLPIYTNVERLDWSLVDAARDLYAGRVRLFLHAILPQTLPGLVVAVVLTLIPALGMFVVPRWLGGAKYMLMGDLVQQQFKEARDWPLGAALSLGLMAITLAGLWLVWRRRREVSQA